MLRSNSVFNEFTGARLSWMIAVGPSLFTTTRPEPLPSLAVLRQRTAEPRKQGRAFDRAVAMRAVENARMVTPANAECSACQSKMEQ